MAWTLDSKQSIYGQIVDVILRRIVTGVYPAGSKLDSVRDLASEAGVNPNTMQRAFAELERDGLVYTQRTSGRFVTKDTEVLKNLRKTLSDDVVEEMCGRLIRLGMSRQEIRSAVEAWASANGTEADE